MDRAKFGNWQHILDEILFKFITNSLLERFSRCSSDIERIEFLVKQNPLQEHKEIGSFFERCSYKQSSKSGDKALKWRTEGNKCFQQSRYQDALQMYTKSLFCAELPSKEYGIALANRSAAQFFIEDYKECLKDAELCMQYGYPLSMHYKVNMRRAHCFDHLGDTAKRDMELDKALTSLECSDIDQSKKDSIKQEAETLRRLPAKGNRGDTALTARPSVSHGNNDVIVQASSHVEMRRNEKQGRFLVARQEVKCGDTLIVEEPFAAVLLPDHYDTHCQHCYCELSSAVFPCQQCLEVRYCSDQCRLKSWNVYHQVECRYHNLLHSVGIAALSMRVILTAGLKFLYSFRDTVRVTDASQHIPGLSENGKYEHGYLSVYDLMTHSKDMLSEDLLHYSLTAVLLLKCLKHAGCFGIDGQKSLDTFAEDEVYVGSLLLRHVLQLVCNAHAITGLQVTQTTDTSLVDSLSQVRIATAIYPTASLMNHSCDPNIISSFQNNLLIVRAVKDLEAGDEVLNCYGPNSKRMERASRQQALKDQYFFDCECDACLVDADKALVYQAFKCPHCEGALVNPGEPMTSHCLDCGRESDVTEQLNAVTRADHECQVALQCLNNGNYKDAINTLIKTLQVKERCLYRFNRDLGQAYDMVGQCYAALGDYGQSAEHVAKSLEITEDIFGASSIETAHELRKLSAIQYNILASVRYTNSVAMETKLKVVRALDIYRTNYSETHNDVQELEEFLHSLEQMGLNQGEQ